jgi:folate-binding protein YgfZ
MSPYDRLRTGVGRVRRSDRGVIRLTGADRALWLQGLVTNDVLAISPGGRGYGAYLTPQGRMITDLWVIRAADALLLEVPATLATQLAGTFDALIFTEDVQVCDESGRLAVWGVYGPQAPDASVAGDVAQAYPDPSFGVPGVIYYLDASMPLPAALADIPVVDLESLDVLRVEAGVPRFLSDMTSETIPLEAGIEDRAISFTKGCYVGQEIIVRVTERGGGRVARRLVGLVLEGSRVPQQGAAIRAGERTVGRVTSAVVSPRLGRVVSLGYVHRDFVATGTPLEVVDGEHPIAAVVAARPFVPAVV